MKKQNASSSAPVDSSMRSKLWTGGSGLALLSAVLLALCLTAHGASLWNGLVLGDYFQIQPFYGIEAKKWPQFWMEIFTEGFLHPFAAPLTKVSLALDYQSAGGQPAIYHAVNVLLHSTCVVSAFLLLARLSSHFSSSRKVNEDGKYSLLIPFAASAVFAVHPLTSDAVANIGGRSALLTFVCYMVALHAFLTGFSAVSVGMGLLGYLFAYLFIVLSTFSGCQAITLPYTMIFVGLLIKPGSDLWKDWIYERVWEFGALLLVAIGLPFIFLLKSTMPAGAGLGLPVLPSESYYATQFKVLLVYYLRIFVLPVALTIAPVYAIASGFSDPLALAGVVVLLGAITLMYKMRKQAFVVLGLYLFIVGMVPQSAVVQAEYASAVRFYLSGFGLTLALVALLVPLLSVDLNQRNLRLPIKISAAFAVTILLLVSLSIWRDRAYSTNSALLRGALRLDPTNARLRGLLAFLLTTDKGPNIERGALEAERALAKDDKLPTAYMALGVYDRWRKHHSEALTEFETALKLASEQNLSTEIVLSAKSGLAQALADSSSNSKPIKDPLRVKELAKAALALYPNDPRLYLAMGKALLAENRPESAELACRQFDQGRRFDRLDIDFTEPYVRAALNTGYPFRFDIAYGAARTADKIIQSDDTNLLLARAALETGRIRKGIDMMKLYFSHAPFPSAEAYKVTGGLAKQLGDTKAAAQYMAKAREIDPDVDKNVRLFLTVPPKPIKEDDLDTPGSAGRALPDPMRSIKK